MKIHLIPPAILLLSGLSSPASQAQSIAEQCANYGTYQDENGAWINCQNGAIVEDELQHLQQNQDSDDDTSDYDYLPDSSHEADTLMQDYNDADAPADAESLDAGEDGY